MSQIERDIIMEHPKVKSTLQRDIIALFHEWPKDPLTFDRIREALIERGQLKKSVGSERWLREKLEQLRDHDILIDVKLPHKKNAGRPKGAYRYNENVVYELFTLTLDLMDAMGFAQIEGKPDKPCLGKIVIKYDSNEYRSLQNRSPPKNAVAGELTIVVKRAKKEDFEKTWRLEQYIGKLKEYCCADHPAYQEYRELKEVEESIKNLEFMKRMGEGGPSDEAIEESKTELAEKSEKFTKKYNLS